MNKRGLTLVEFITSFALASIVVILLLNVIIILRDIYTKSNIKSDIVIEQSSLSNQLNKEFTKDNLLSYVINDSNNYVFTFTDGIYDLHIYKNETKIKFGDFTYKFPEGTKIGDMSLDIKTYEVSTGDNSILILKIPITNPKFPNENFDIKIVYMYNSISIDL